MKRRLLFLAVTLFAFCAASFAQWQFVKAFTPYHAPLKPNDLWGPHGVAVDPDGKIWVAPYDGSDTTLGSGSLVKRRQIFVFNVNGTPASFSPINAITVGGITDSLNGDVTGRGLGTDNNGNILYSSFDRLFRINYKTGQGMSKIVPGGGASITKASVDAAGNIFVVRVSGNKQPIKIYATDFSFLANAIDSVVTPANISRCVLISDDGTTLYHPVAFSTDANNKVYVYQNQLGPGFGTYALVDSLFGGMQVESIAWQPRSGKKPLLWVSSGSRNNPPDTTKWRKNGRVWYGMDTDTKAIVDSIPWGATFPGNPSYDDTVIVNQAARPRGIAFTSTGDTVYLAMYLADSNSVKMFVRTGAAAVEPIAESRPVEYALSQNYPNPFNPSTEIQFSVPKAGLTTLSVYDILGREVMTLVNENLGAGSYKTTLDATRLSSGTYIYTLSSNGIRISKKMLLMK